MYRRTKTISPIDESSPKKNAVSKGGVDKYHAFAVCYNYECVGKAGVVRRGGNLPSLIHCGKLPSVAKHCAVRTLQ